jgi:hypothetical protein
MIACEIVSLADNRLLGPADNAQPIVPDVAAYAHVPSECWQKRRRFQVMV